MTNRALIAGLLAMCALLAFAATAPAKTRKRAVLPTVTSVAPKRAAIGAKLSLRGRNFSRRRAGNVVILRSGRGKTVFVKPSRASRRRLVISLPARLDRALDRDAGGTARATRFRIRVLARRLGRFTSRRRSLVVLPRSGGAGGGGSAPAISDCDRDGYANSFDDDDDNDLLTDSAEDAIDTDTCRADSDGDGVEDGFEQLSALDLNQNALPYPGRRPFANALDPSDGGHDYDGDGLSSSEEFAAWAKGPASPAPPALQSYWTGPEAPAFGGPYATQPRFGGHMWPLNYSDGKQATLAVDGSHPEYRTSLDLDGDGMLSDDERDVDGDGLGNVEELRLRATEGYYPFEDPGCKYAYKPMLPVSFAALDYLNWDTDGDGVWDGDDDQDHDDVSNVDEIVPPYRACSTPGLFPEGGTLAPDGGGGPRIRNPFNPCLPYQSRTCARYGG
jgi:hypothetical protein